MNLFIVDPSPSKAAIALCDQHINKMILETAQIIDGGTRPLMAQIEPASAPHQIVKIPKSHRDNRTIHTAADKQVRWWALQHLDALLLEFRHRWGHHHAYAFDVRTALVKRATKVSGFSMAKGFYLAMPEEYGGGRYVQTAAEAVEPYRDYYASEKHVFGNKTSKPTTWLRRTPPRWMQVSLRDRGYRQVVSQDGRYVSFKRIETHEPE